MENFTWYVENLNKANIISKTKGEKIYKFNNGVIVSHKNYFLLMSDNEPKGNEYIVCDNAGLTFNYDRVVLDVKAQKLKPFCRYSLGQI